MRWYREDQASDYRSRTNKGIFTEEGKAMPLVDLGHCFSTTSIKPVFF